MRVKEEHREIFDAADSAKNGIDVIKRLVRIPKRVQMAGMVQPIFKEVRDSLDILEAAFAPESKKKK